MRNLAIDFHYLIFRRGLDDAVGTVTRYGLGGSGIEFLLRRDFPHHRSHPRVYSALYTMSIGFLPAAKSAGAWL
jgi:hypothetical protein